LVQQLRVNWRFKYQLYLIDH